MNWPIYNYWLFYNIIFILFFHPRDEIFHLLHYSRIYLLNKSTVKKVIEAYTYENKHKNISLVTYNNLWSRFLPYTFVELNNIMKEKYTTNIGILLEHLKTGVVLSLHLSNHRFVVPMSIWTNFVLSYRLSNFNF